MLAVFGAIPHDGEIARSVEGYLLAKVHDGGAASDVSKFELGKFLQSLDLRIAFERRRGIGFEGDFNF